MNTCQGQIFALLAALALPAVSHAHAVSAPGPEVDWQIGVVALAIIAIIGGAMIVIGNARRRRETRAAEQAARQDAAQAQAAITGGEVPRDRPADDLHAMAADLDDSGFRPRKPRQGRHRDSAGESGGGRDQNTPGTSLQRTRSQ